MCVFVSGCMCIHMHVGVSFPILPVFLVPCVCGSLCVRVCVALCVCACVWVFVCARVCGSLHVLVHLLRWDALGEMFFQHRCKFKTDSGNSGFSPYAEKQGCCGPQ